MRIRKNGSEAIAINVAGVARVANGRVWVVYDAHATEPRSFLVAVT